MWNTCFMAKQKNKKGSVPKSVMRLPRHWMCCVGVAFLLLALLLFFLLAAAATVAAVVLAARVVVARMVLRLRRKLLLCASRSANWRVMNVRDGNIDVVDFGTRVMVSRAKSSKLRTTLGILERKKALGLVRRLSHPHAHHSIAL